jgi:hypothetical protein
MNILIVLFVIDCVLLIGGFVTMVKMNPSRKLYWIARSIFFFSAGGIAGILPYVLMNLVR